MRRFDKKVEQILEPWVYEQVQALNGSISAEHGLGIAKKDFIGYSRSDTMIGLMKAVKNLYDPVGLPCLATSLTTEANYENRTAS